MRVLEKCDEPCPIERSMRIIGGKWTASTLWHLQNGPVRFNALTRQLGGASKKMINQRLKELEEHQLVHRKVVSDRPVAVEYSLTEFGVSVLAILEQLYDWSKKNNI